MNVPKKKILFVITKSNFGGAQRYVYEIATGLPKNDFEVVVAFGGSGLLKEKLVGAHIDTLPIKSFDRDINIKKECRSVFELAHIIRSLRPDVVHLNSSKAGGTGALVARLMGVPNIIFTAHGWPFRESRNWLWKSVVWFFSYVTVILTHHTIVVSEHDVRNHHMPFVTQKITHIGNAMTPIPFLTRAEAQSFIIKKISFVPPPDALWIGTIGEYTRNKNLLVSIEAVHRAREQYGLNLLYILIGIDGEERPRLEEYIRVHNLSTCVFLAGFIDDARNYLKAFDLFMLPSRKEGLPYAILEAGVAGLPCIASNVGGIPEIIDEGISGLLIDPQEVNSFVRALASLARSPAERSRYGRALQKKIMSEFNTTTMITQTVALYRASH